MVITATSSPDTPIYIRINVEDCSNKSIRRLIRDVFKLLFTLGCLERKAVFFEWYRAFFLYLARDVISVLHVQGRRGLKPRRHVLRQTGLAPSRRHPRGATDLVALSGGHGRQPVIDFQMSEETGPAAIPTRSFFVRFNRPKKRSDACVGDV